MYEGEGLGRVIIDLDALLGEAMMYMDRRGDFAFPLGQALISLNQGERMQAVMQRMDTMWRLANEDEPLRDSPTA